MKEYDSCHIKIVNILIKYMHIQILVDICELRHILVKSKSRKAVNDIDGHVLSTVC